AGNGFNPSHHSTAEDKAAEDTKSKRGSQAYLERVQKQLAKVASFANIATHKQTNTRLRIEQLTGAHVGQGGFRPAQIVDRKIDPQIVGFDRLRPIAQISGE